MILLGPPGVGKTHVSVALAEAAIQCGFGAYFLTAHGLAPTSAELFAIGGWTGACGSILPRGSGHQ